MTELLRDLQDSMLALDERLAGLESAGEHASSATRRLALNVVEMGDALARRVRALEAGERAPEPTTPEPAVFAAPPPVRPARKAPDRTLAWVIGLAVLLGAVIGGLWLLRSGVFDTAPKSVAPAPAQVEAPPPPPPAAAPAVVPPPAAKPATTVHHYGAVRHARPPVPAPAAPETAVPYKSLTNSTP